MYPEDCLYSKDHEWVRVEEDDRAVVGITDFAQDELGEVVFVELPEVGGPFDAGDEIGTIESVKAVAEIYTPVAGEVVEVNEALEDGPRWSTTILTARAGWSDYQRLADEADLDELMDAEAYEASSPTAAEPSRGLRSRCARARPAGAVLRRLVSGACCRWPRPVAACRARSRLSLYQLYGLAARRGWLVGNLYVQRARKLPRRSARVLLHLPAGAAGRSSICCAPWRRRRAAGRSPCRHLRVRSSSRSSSWCRCRYAAPAGPSDRYRAGR